MSILTTEYRGLAAGINSPHFHLAQASMNGIRLRQWRERLTRSANTPTSSDRAADYARSKGRAVSWLTQAARFAGLSLVAVVFIGGISVWVIVPYALLTLDEPETRTFERPVSNDTYERSQRVWRVEE